MHKPKKNITFAPEFKNGAIAQLVEQRTENPCVPGSIPGGTTKRDSNKSLFCLYTPPDHKATLVPLYDKYSFITHLPTSPAYIYPTGYNFIVSLTDFIADEL